MSNTHIPAWEHFTKFLKKIQFKVDFGANRFWNPWEVNRFFSLFVHIKEINFIYFRYAVLKGVFHNTRFSWTFGWPYLYKKENLTGFGKRLKITALKENSVIQKDKERDHVWLKISTNFWKL